MPIRFPLPMLASSIALVTAVPALAQEAPAEAPTEGEIVVTAQFVEQRPIEVPFALTAYDDKFLERLNIQEFDALSRYVPGFEVQNQSPNNPGFVMRGITSDSGSAFNEPRVSVFQDGVSISKSRGSYVELFDMERIEVAKGPQSTLYGRGALIGAVNLIQAKADPKAGYGMLHVSGGDYGMYRVDGTWNIPLAENLAIRAAARVKKRDGFVEDLLGGRDFNGIESEAVRGSLRWEPAGFTFDLIGNYQTDRATGTAFKSIAYNPTDTITGAVIGNRGRNSGAALAAGPGFEGGKRLGLEREVWGVTGIANAELGNGFALNGTLAYREFSGTEIFDADGISLPALTAAEDAAGTQTMATLRLNWDNGGPLKGFVGATYFYEDGHQRAPSQFDERVALARVANALNGGGAIPGRPATDPAPISVFGNTAFTSQLLRGIVRQNVSTLVPAGTPNRDAVIDAQTNLILPVATATGIAANLKSAHRETSTNFSRTKAWDLFADVTFDVTDAFQIGGGIRYSRDDKRTRYTASVQNGRSILGGFIGALSQSEPTRTALLNALAVPGAANIPQSALYPVPMFGLGLQPTAGNGNLAEASNDSGGFTWRATARYELSPQASVYANYARGRRPEVLGVSPPAAPSGAARFNLLPAETVDSFEVGLKTELMGRTLFFDAAAFYYDYSNFQTTEQVGTTFVTVNAGKAESYGFEGQMRWNPADWVNLFATYAYNHSRFKAGARDGNRFRLSPDHSASAGMTLRGDVGPVAIDFTPDVTWQSRVFFDDDNDIARLQTGNLIPDTVQDEVQGAFATVNARIGIETANGRWRIEGFVTNLFDKEYIKDADNTGDGLGMPTFIAGEPRMWGASLTLRLGGK